MWHRTHLRSRVYTSTGTGGRDREHTSCYFYWLKCVLGDVHADVGTFEKRFLPQNAVRRENARHMLQNGAFRECLCLRTVLQLYDAPNALRNHSFCMWMWFKMTEYKSVCDRRSQCSRPETMSALFGRFISLNDIMCLCSCVTAESKKYITQHPNDTAERPIVCQSIRPMSF